MCEVTAENFSEVFTKIESSFRNAKFITIDTEFSALWVSAEHKNSLFDTPKIRYGKLKALCEQIIPVQIGLTSFTFEADENAYHAEMYTFYVFPRPFMNINPKFVCQSASLQFLCNYNFDFNKFVYNGISFINRKQELEVGKYLKNEKPYEVNNADHELESLLESETQKIGGWISKSKKGDILILPGICTKYKNNFDVLHLLHKYLRRCFNRSLWTFEANNEFVVKKVSHEEYTSLEVQHNLNDELIKNLLGFTRVFRLLVDLKKPLIGHNLLTDLMILFHNFDEPLPESYYNFKKQLCTHFPTIYDTKVLSFDIKTMIPKNKSWSKNSLSGVFEYFKDGTGRHIALNSPLIDLENKLDYDHFHNAGWDSYCTGYVFIRMAHIFASSNYTVNRRKFMCSELFASVKRCKNSVNLIRCSVSHIQLDGEDPVSRRPPCLIVESLKNKPIDISHITHMLSTYGFVEIKPYSSGGRRAIVAVDNSTSARRILQKFKSHTDFQIKQYSLVKHSPAARAILWSGILASGALLTWLAHSALKK